MLNSTSTYCHAYWKYTEKPPTLYSGHFRWHQWCPHSTVVYIYVSINIAQSLEKCVKFAAIGIVHSTNTKSKTTNIDQLFSYLFLYFSKSEQLYAMIRIWQSRIDIEYYSVAYFKCTTKFDSYSAELPLRVGLIHAM